MSSLLKVDNEIKTKVSFFLLHIFKHERFKLDEQLVNVSWLTGNVNVNNGQPACESPG